jgi:hypothetical protein
MDFDRFRLFGNSRDTHDRDDRRAEHDDVRVERDDQRGGRDEAVVRRDAVAETLDPASRGAAAVPARDDPELLERVDVRTGVEEPGSSPAASEARRPSPIEPPPMTAPAAAADAAPVAAPPAAAAPAAAPDELSETAPTRPKTVAETGIEHDVLVKLLAKWLQTLGTATPSRIGAEIKLAKPVVTQLIEAMTKLSLVEARGLHGSSTDMTAEVRYALSAAGIALAEDAFEQSSYLGPAPVSLEAFREQIRKQSILAEHLDYADIKRCFSHLVLPEFLIRRLGPAANSGKTMLLYGEPGNGKTSIAEALAGAYRQTIYFPYAIEIDGHYISFFDTSVHERVQRPAISDGADLYVSSKKRQLDERWVECKRPVVMTGGELTLDMLDLRFNPFSKFYEAPLHLKAVGGIFIVDDFGRQQDAPQAILNRWIVPLERKEDFLTLHTGRKFTIPFDELVVFSTNIAPQDLVDQAALRRLYYKILIPNPTKEDYFQIFRDVCSSHGIALDEEMLSQFYDAHYETLGYSPSGYHPKFLIDHVLATCGFTEEEVRLDRDLLDEAWKDLYVEQ